MHARSRVLPRASGGRRRPEGRLHSPRQAREAGRPGRAARIPRWAVDGLALAALLRWREHRPAGGCRRGRRLPRPLRRRGDRRPGQPHRRPRRVRRRRRPARGGGVRDRRPDPGPRPRHDPARPSRHRRRAERHPHLRGGGAAAELPHAGGVPRERLPGGPARDAGRDHRGASDLDHRGGARGVRPARPGRGHGSRRHLPTAHLGRGDRRLQAARQRGRRDLPQPARRRLQRARLPGEPHRRRWCSRCPPTPASRTSPGRWTSA